MRLGNLMMRIVRHSSGGGLLLAALVVLGCSSGCGGSRSFLHADADIDFYERVGVLPFATLGTDRLAGDKMSSAFTTHLMISRRFVVAEPGQFLSVYQKQIGTHGAAPIGLSLDKLKLLQEEAGVQGVFEGTIREFDYTRGTPPRPMISAEVRLVDVVTGEVVWSTSVTRVGRPKVPILGLGGSRTLAELMEEVASTLVARLP